MRKFACLLAFSSLVVASNAWPFDIAEYATDIPDTQKKFLEAIEKARTDYDSAPNEMAKGGTRPARAKAICALVKPGKTVKDWVGEITKLTTNGEGKGVVTVSIGENVALSTWNNALSDVSDKTMIEPDSPLFSKVASLEKGAMVKLSGRFFASKTDCVSEKSMTMSGSMTDPEFTFRFSDVEPLL